MSSELLCTLSAAGAGTPLFLVPSIGSTPLSLVRLARAIAPRRPVRGFAYAGMEDDQPAHTTLAEIAAACVAELVALFPRGPYLLGGHCLGATVALEMALQLEARGANVARLVVLDALAPPLADAGAEHGALDIHVRRALEALVARTVSHYPKLPPEVSRRLGAVLKIHIDAGAAYRARPLRARTNVLHTEGCDDDVLAAWARIATGGLATQLVPGDTFSMLRPPHVEAVGRHVGGALHDAG